MATEERVLCFERKLFEELGLLQGLSLDVGYVHFGVVHVVYVADEAVAGRRSGIVRPEFVPLAEAVKDASGYESWSRFCLEHLDSLLLKAAVLGVTVPERAVA